MRPLVPAKGDPVLASWAGDVIDYAGSRWRYVPRDDVTAVTSRPYPNNTSVELELTELPANDPTVVAALIHAMVRETSTSSRVLSIYDGSLPTDVRVGFVGAGGYASRGNGGTAYIVRVGGTNGRSIRFFGSASSTASCWVTVLGHFIEESDEPVAGSSDPITAPLPEDPVAGEPMLASWGESLLGMVGKGWRYHPIPEAAGTARSDAGTWAEAVPDVIPVDAVAASCYLRMRPSNTNNISATIYDSDGTSAAGIIYSSGVASCYSVTGHHPVILDATRQYTLSVSAATTETLAVFTGYWTKDA